MKTKTLILRILPAVLVAGILFAACQKSGRTATRSYPAAVQNQVLAATNDYAARTDEEGDDFDMMEGYGEYADGTTTELLPSCYTRTYVPSKDVLPHQIIYDFGAGCTTPNGKLFKKGKIIVTKYDPAVTGGKAGELGYDGFQINDYKYSGGLTSYASVNSQGQTVRRTVSKVRLTNCTTGDWSEYIGERSYTVTEGGETPTRSDDKTDICGVSLGRQSVAGVVSDLWESNVALNNHIKRIFNCPQGRKNIQGAVNIRIHIQCTGFDILNEVLDYGDGTCDAIRTLYVEGVPTAVDFPIQAWPYN